VSLILGTGCARPTSWRRPWRVAVPRLALRRARRPGRD